MSSPESIYNAVLSALNATGVDKRQKAEVINWMIETHSWPVVSDAFEKILISQNHDYAECISEVYFSASLEGKAFNCNTIAALLLNCGIGTGSPAYNLVLGICVEKRDVEYQSFSPVL